MIPASLSLPPSEYGLIPFWFWNDTLEVNEILRQIQDFQTHGVSGFVIHPRVGLPRYLGWMSDQLLEFYQIAIQEAQRRQMIVFLYDEGMYPSGSASGQVVAENPVFACRCLAKVALPDDQFPVLKPDENLVALVKNQDRSYMAVIDRPANSVIRGLHYIGQGPLEDEPPAADILNPLAVETFIRLVYEKFARHFSEFFGETIQAIFTDEPGLLGRSRERGVVPGTTGILEHVNRILGYDFTPHFPALWDEGEPDADRFRRDYAYALSLRLEETYYQPLSNWCEAHGLALTGHPHKGDEIGPLRYFHIPGQDLVWRWVLPDQPSALQGVESTQAKCSASAMLHHRRRRNANECCGAYGHEMTWEEMNWLARWAFVRGVNLLIPHAFYYSVRGLRRDERPPDVGPNSSWWGRFPEFALVCQRLSWINTDSQHICSLAILGRSDFLPWQSAKICFCYQYDFNYLEERDISMNAEVDEEGIFIAGMRYTALILEREPPPEVMHKLAPLVEGGKVFRYIEGKSESELLTWLGKSVPRDLRISPAAAALRLRHVIKEGCHFYLLFNEERAPLSFQLDFSMDGNWISYDVATGQEEPLPGDHFINLKGYELKLLIS